MSLSMYPIRSWISYLCIPVLCTYTQHDSLSLSFLLLVNKPQSLSGAVEWSLVFDVGTNPNVTWCQKFDCRNVFCKVPTPRRFRLLSARSMANLESQVRKISLLDQTGRVRPATPGGYACLFHGSRGRPDFRVFEPVGGGQEENCPCPFSIRQVFSPWRERDPPEDSFRALRAVPRGNCRNVCPPTTSRRQVLRI